jgi:hypothetical protein
MAFAFMRWAPSDLAAFRQAALLAKNDSGAVGCTGGKRCLVNPAGRLDSMGYYQYSDSTMRIANRLCGRCIGRWPWLRALVKTNF